MDPQQRRTETRHRPPVGEPGGDVSSIFIAFGVFIAIAALVMFPSSLVHQVPEGYVGAYWRGGALLNIITEPGFQLKLPFITNYEPVQVTLQTDQVKDIPCGTKGGVMITFEKIEVVNRLRKDYVYDTLLNYGVDYDNTWIYDKIHHEINQFCSSYSLQQVYIDIFDQIDERMKEALQADCTRYAPGIEIISVRVTKPKIPESVRRNFEQMEEERTKMYLDRQKSLADADYYRVLREAEANKLKLTPEFLELKFIDAIARNTKMFFGDKAAWEFPESFDKRQI
ncbi:hypothetical protein EUTSA_v10022792mg [Eutrema salsugineum]|uniref:Band 7 domain-containing protein n=1 Tax=Eutrema salsugineum TaxID=72664 RepID=V4M4C2_EUTSA|nr:hypothetical protein EUTSA_v10022792mg [Eutrema salsugineum]